MTFVVGNKTIIDKMSGRPCVAIGFFHEVAIMSELIFTLWVTFHIFCYAVFYKDMKRLEIVYVVTSLLPPCMDPGFVQNNPRMAEIHAFLRVTDIYTHLVTIRTDDLRNNALIRANSCLPPKKETGECCVSEPIHTIMHISHLCLDNSIAAALLFTKAKGFTAM